MPLTTTKQSKLFFCGRNHQRKNKVKISMQINFINTWKDTSFQFTPTFIVDFKDKDAVVGWMFFLFEIHWGKYDF